MVKQYPHFLYTFTTQPAVQNELGDWVPGTSEMTPCGPCREETAGRDTVCSAVDFKDFVPAALVQCPLSCQHITEGTTVVVSNTPLDASTTMEQAKALQSLGSVRIFGICKKFDRSTFHVRLWL